ncbi:MAG: hypothetical protein COV41_00380 [Candidatus Brennerbacteria bacterium CG11_big_fil_rev_8_21_14_0_20_43_10]|uniref:Lactamase n=3 Tax=Candidatus Brenneribacteriota TaxID=1817902 RepID=A0A2M8C2K3_9BACT|nr:MAG: hypothetical protein AUJ43_02125 [Parcubacteria group bacterium CG1_02_44_31]PIP50365.1 MAG: hypothetical protein COX12_01640 [Candidatus Brennerbacteria bacterium CG23_combo_of_CG06-09_8_20_14_all_44_41]PIR26923.1 MAG: hypothetical protein COV41_00380 [Candidatus Brennerbacteria bacterium CG11_big_fil_rev_8_21_14_0_20_43_10]PIX28671.1 MAG: hypothetical protein COZ64_02400 [Candidatus Brennerbacteria bacterium CG_4_8_14_3_um_filter_43_14]PJA19055.1 MAG: hypothetical protein COX61_02260 
MILTWYGASCFKIETQDMTLALSPFGKNEALGIAKSPRFKANIMLISQHTPLYNSASGIDNNPFVIDQPGEYEVGGIFFYGIQTPSANTAFVIRSEDITIAYLAGMKDVKLSEEIMRRFENADILIVPSGGDDVYNSSQAARIAAQLEPCLVIPMHYKVSGMKGKWQGVDAFIKEMNAQPESQDKLNIRKRDIPKEGMRVVVLEPQGITKV